MNIPAVCDTERLVEVPWIVERLGHPQHLLDVGATDSFYLDDLLATGATVTLLDTRPVLLPPGSQAHIALRDITSPLPSTWDAVFDLVICCSVLDHIGLDAYGNTADAQALERCVANLVRITAPGGRLLLTVPCGRDMVTTHPGGG